MEQLIKNRIKARRQILFSPEDPCFQSLQLLIDASSRKALVCWALELAAETARLLDPRAELAVIQSRRWAAGEIKMPEAKAAILACHAAAKETSSPADVARYHAVGQACGTVHTKGHALGFPVYDLTALVRSHGAEGSETLITERVEYYIRRLMFWNSPEAPLPSNWAGFLD